MNSKSEFHGPAGDGSVGNEMPPMSIPAARAPSAQDQDDRAYPSANLRITPQARRYAIGELARRAGVPANFLQTWKISFTRDNTIIEIANGTRKQIQFPHVSEASLRRLEEGHLSCSRALWMDDSTLNAGRIPELIVPFVNGERPREPLFRPLDENSIACTADLPLSVLLTLSRWEESFQTPRDQHGRFMAVSSIAWRNEFLMRPVVDECALAFEEALQFLFPTWPKRARALRIKVSHDVDHVGIPIQWKGAMRHAIRRRAPQDSLLNLMAWLPNVEPAELRAVREIVLLSNGHALAPAVYWKASPIGARDSGYDPADPRVRGAIEWLRERGIELGVHPGYETFLCPEKLHREVGAIREVLGNGPLGGRQHYLRWSPVSWIHWENCGLAYDSSVGFAEHIGFRAGTCIPYRPWLFALNRESELLEIPLLVMDRTLLAYMKLSLAECLDASRTCLERCAAVGGVFTLLWHNDSFLDPVYRDVYVRLLQMLQGIPQYDWRKDVPGPLVPSVR
jgi:hypothetical protein